jgi:hypothetical protein
VQNILKVLIALMLSSVLLHSETTLAFLLDADSALAPDTRSELALELAALLAPAGVQVVVQDLAPLNQLGAVSALVSVHLHGVRLVEVGRSGMPVSGSLGWVKQMDGVVQPFIHVDAAAVAVHIGPSFLRGQEMLARILLGRALARVVMHEVLHWLTQSAEHGEGLLFRPSVSPSTLIGDGIGLEAAEIWMARRGLGLAGDGVS